MSVDNTPLLLTSLLCDEVIAQYVLKRGYKPKISAIQSIGMPVLATQAAWLGS